MYPYTYIVNCKVSLYSLCVFLGSIISFVILTLFLKRQKLVHVYIPKLGAGFIGLIIGAKFCGIISKCLHNWVSNGNIDLYDSIKNSGIVYLGGLFGFLFVIQMMCWLRKENKYIIYDGLAVVIPLFHTFGRIGCFFAGCCYGQVNSGWLSFPYRIGFQGEWLNRVPIQLIEACFEFLLFVIFFVLYIKKQKEQSPSNGLLMYLYLSLYSVLRFALEFYRGDDVRGVLFGISFSQIICIITIICFVLKYIKYKKRKEN